MEEQHRSAFKNKKFFVFFYLSLLRVWLAEWLLHWKGGNMKFERYMRRIFGRVSAEGSPLKRYGARRFEFTSWSNERFAPCAKNPKALRLEALLRKQLLGVLTPKHVAIWIAVQTDCKKEATAALDAHFLLSWSAVLFALANKFEDFLASIHGLFRTRRFGSQSANTPDCSFRCAMDNSRRRRRPKRHPGDSYDCRWGSHGFRLFYIQKIFYRSKRFSSEALRLAQAQIRRLTWN